MLPFIYQRPWFLPLMALAVAGGRPGCYWLRVRRIRLHLQLVLAERSRIARELHDTLMQGFSGVTMEMQALSVRLPQSRSEPPSKTSFAMPASACAMPDARWPDYVARQDDTSGLTEAISAAARHITETHEVHLRLRLQPSPRQLSTDVQYNLLRIVQEAVGNAVKHSGGSLVEVMLECTPQQLCLSVKDDGLGFSYNEHGELPGHYGLIGMRERAAQIGARLRIDSEPGRGTLVSVTLPIGPTVRTSLPAPLPADPAAKLPNTID